MKNCCPTCNSEEFMKRSDRGFLDSVLCVECGTVYVPITVLKSHLESCLRSIMEDVKETEELLSYEISVKHYGREYLEKELKGRQDRANHIKKLLEGARYQ